MHSRNRLSSFFSTVRSAFGRRPGTRRLAAMMLAVLVVPPGACRTTDHTRDHGHVEAGVAADHPAAAIAGRNILRQGGNAVDAAVATAFALSVVRPESCGIGGGGFTIIYLVDDPRTPTPGDAVTVAIDARERAPAAITPDHFERLAARAAPGAPPNAQPASGATGELDAAQRLSRFTGHAVAVPGTVAGLLKAHDLFGALPLDEVLAPAIELAERGYEIDAYRVNAEAEAFGARRVAGETVRDARQGSVLRRIAREGHAGFYRGPVAEAIVNAVQAAGGVMTLDDLARYEAKVVNPLVQRVGERTWITMPPPSSGGIALLQIAGVIERARAAPKPRSPDDPTWRRLLVYAMKHSFADRARYLADPEFVAVPIDQLLDPRLLDRRAAEWNLGRKPEDIRDFGARLRGAPALLDDGGTSHYCVVDADGNAVSGTETINLLFGSRIEASPLGFYLNNQMDDFTTMRGQANAFGLVQSDRNLPEPGKRPLSSMSPTIVLSPGGDVELVVGASGGPRIITATLQASFNALVFHMSARDAVRHRRLHHQWMPDELRREPRDPESDPLGYVQLIRREQSGGWDGAGDERKGGAFSPLISRPPSR